MEETNIDSDAPLYEWCSDEEPPKDNTGDWLIVSNDGEVVKTIVKTGLGYEKPGFGDEILVRIADPDGDLNEAPYLKGILGYEGEFSTACHLAAKTSLRREQSIVECSDNYSEFKAVSHTKEYGYASSHKATVLLKKRLYEKRSRDMTNNDMEFTQKTPFFNHSSSTYKGKPRVFKLPAPLTMKYRFSLIDFLSVHNLTEHRDVLKKIIVKGHGWETPSENDTVSVLLFEIPDVDPDKLRPTPVYNEHRSQILELVVNKQAVPFRGLCSIICSMKINEVAHITLKNEQSKADKEFKDDTIHYETEISGGIICGVKLLDFVKKKLLTIPYGDNDQVELYLPAHCVNDRSLMITDYVFQLLVGMSFQKCDAKGFSEYIQSFNPVLQKKKK